MDLIKLDFRFNIVWRKCIDYSSLGLHFKANDIKHDNNNGGYALCGRFIVNFSGEFHGFLMKIDDFGNILWLKDAVDGNPLVEHCKELRSVEIVNDHYISCGYAIRSGYNRVGCICSIRQSDQYVEWVRLIHDYTNGNDVELNDLIYNPATNNIYTCGTWFDNTTPFLIQAVVARYDLTGVNIRNLKYNWNNSTITGKAITVNTYLITPDLYITGDLDGTDFQMFSVDASAIAPILNEKLHIELSNKVQDILYYRDNLFYTGGVTTENTLHLNPGMLLQTKLQGYPIFSSLYSNYTIGPISDIMFYKMLYRTLWTDPSIIKIGLTNNRNAFYIAETFIPYQSACNDIEHDVKNGYDQLELQELEERYGGPDLPNLDHISLYEVDIKENVLCESHYFSSMANQNKSSIEILNTIVKDGVDEIHVLNDQIILSSSYENTNYKLYSIDGRLINEGKINNDFTIDISTYNIGIYLLTLQSIDNSFKTVKVIR